MRSKKGFTLIELLVVIAVIALLMSIIMPALGKAKVAARRTVCLGNVHGVMLAAAAYSVSNDDFTPRSGRGWPYEGALDISCLLTDAGLDPTLLHCPDDKQDPGAISTWWKTAVGTTLSDSDYMDRYQPQDLGIKADNDFSYIWSAKLFYPVDTPGASDPVKWRMSDVRQPARLLVFMHFWSLTDVLSGMQPLPHGDIQGKVGYSAGFLDGHSEFLLLKDMKPRVSAADASTRSMIAPYASQFSEDEIDAFANWNPDWNPNGIKGSDF